MSDTRGVTFQIWSHSVLQTVIVFNPIPDKIELRINSRWPDQPRRTEEGGALIFGEPTNTCLNRCQARKP